MRGLAGACYEFDGPAEPAALFYGEAAAQKQSYREQREALEKAIRFDPTEADVLILMYPHQRTRMPFQAKRGV